MILCSLYTFIEYYKNRSQAWTPLAPLAKGGHISIYIRSYKIYVGNIKSRPKAPHKLINNNKPMNNIREIVLCLIT